MDQGRVLLEPRNFAKILDALEIDNDDMVLDLGIGLGYSAAVIAQMAEAVIGVESDEALATEAQAALAQAGADNVVVETGDLAAGAAQHGPYDVITIQGGVEDVPAALIAQLKDGGRMACIFMDGKVGAVRIGHKINGEMSWRFSFNAAAPVLAGFEHEKAFSL